MFFSCSLSCIIFQKPSKKEKEKIYTKMQWQVTQGALRYCRMCQERNGFKKCALNMRFILNALLTTHGFGIFLPINEPFLHHACHGEKEWLREHDGCVRNDQRNYTEWMKTTVKHMLMYGRWSKWRYRDMCASFSHLRQFFNGMQMKAFLIWTSVE